GEEYRAELTSANQALAKAASYGVAGRQEAELSTASALVSSYSYLVQQAARSAVNKPLRTAYLANARSTEEDIVERLGTVQREQRALLHRQAAFGRPLTLLWSAALALCAGLLALLAWTQRLLRVRFRRRFNPGLAAGTLLLAAGVPTVTVLAVQIQHRLSTAAARIEHDRTHGGISLETLQVRQALGNARWQEGATSWIVVTAVAVAALVLLGLLPRIDEYRFTRPVRRARNALTGRRAHRITAAVLAVWLVGLGVLVYAEQRGARQTRLTVLASWEDPEATGFREVLKSFERSHPDVGVTYEHTTALREVLLARIRTGTAPDIAVLPSRGEAADYAAQGVLQPLGDVLPKGTADAYGPRWVPKVSGQVYAVPVKADLKSIVWYDAASPPRDPAAAARDGAHWCAGMGGGDTVGWPGTDWIEDLLLQQSGTQAYEKLASGGLSWTSDEMRKAWTAFGGIFTAAPAQDALGKDWLHDGFLSGGSGGSGSSGGSACSLEHQATFARSGYGGRADFTPTPGVLPGTDARSPAREVSADYAALFGRSPAAKALLGYLTTPRAQRAWAAAHAPGRADNPFRPFFPFSRPQVIPASERLNQHIDRELRSARTLCLDASDAMPPRMRFAFQHAVLDYLSEPTGAKLDKVLADLETERRQVGPRQDHVCTG
ncbi:ABC transporter substrate-binding protein, partial [Streptomyces sp. UNOC14_S4]|uniref:ABC transporter substrate-binding protein n=1 Tax=Streptomyces sp. UNOC14_S4 TaxID=2872340 RepID=UPI001E33B407